MLFLAWWRTKRALWELDIARRLSRQSCSRVAAQDVSRRRGTTLHEIWHRLLSEMSSCFAELPVLQTLIRYHCSFYLGFYIKANVGKANPSIIILSCCHSVTPQEPAHFRHVQWAQQFFWHSGHSLGEAGQEEGGTTTFCSSLTLCAC